MTDPDSLKRWLCRAYPGRGREHFTFWDYLFAEGTPQAALLYAKLYAPTFIEVEGLILLGDVVADAEDRVRVRQALERYGDPQEVERQFNTVELDSLLVHGDRNADDDEVDRLLAMALVEVWSALLTKGYPNRRFTVRVVEPSEIEGNWGIVFYQEVRSLRPATRKTRKR